MQTRGADAPAAPPAKKAIGYFRPSVDGAEERQRVLQETERLFHAFCGRNGYEPCGTFADADGAGPEGSPTYRAMLDRIRREGGPLTVVVPALDALGARRDDVAIAVLELEELGARVQVLGGALVDPIRVATGPWSKGDHALELGERIKSAMRKRAIRGEGLGKPPYGYRIGRTKKLEVHNVEADTVRLVFSLYTQKNMGIRLIVRHLNEQKIPTRKGRNWSMVTIRDILRNRAYLGTYTRFGMRIPGSHPAIITPDMFRWAQSRLDERRPRRKNGQAEPFLLSGLIYCGQCGNRMVGVTRKQAWTRRRDGSRVEKQYRYYQCQSRTNQSVCEYHTRRAGELEAIVLEYLQGQQARLGAIQPCQEKAGAARPSVKERQKLLTARRGVERRLRQALHTAATGAVSQQRFRAQISQLLGARRQLDERLASLDRAVPAQGDGQSPGEQAVAFIDRLAACEPAMDLSLRRALLQTLVEAVTVFDDRVKIKLRLG